MDIVKFGETVLRDKNKKGELKPDENGYYTLIIGGLNVYNSAGEYYTSNEALKLFESSSHLMRRIKNGALYSELGHPKKAPNMTMENFYNRVVSIEETNICAHIKEVQLDFNYGKNNPQFNNKDMIAVIGKIKPAGAKASALESALNSPEQNVAFSVRGLTDNRYINGRVERSLTEIITWDYVLEPGINIANKWNSPVLEELNEVTIDRQLLVKIASESLNSKVATENCKTISNDIINKYSLKINGNKLSKW